ncbi:hypothetical protein [Lacticaseibacillus zhaodongensis]|uniref:hypothetical protein n=1 Tax=Lacticaseibacillus zhaodongensis TaxID=2668065 RepID=UPI0012D2EEF2|nr:hypothetical protein [Lacticaseibacillus zhaodongensis]
MDYWKQRRAYRSLKLLELNISSGQNNLYRELLDYANDEGKMDGQFGIKNEALASLTGLSDRGMKEARNALVQSGLITYKPGKRSASVPMYQIIKLYREKGQSARSSASGSASGSTELVPQVVPQKVPEVVPPSTCTTTDYNKTNKKSTSKPKKPVYAEASEEYKLALKLWNQIQERLPETKAPNLQHWADDIRKMHQLDKREYKKISGMIDWSQQDGFWQGNVLSAAALRKDYDKMAAQANRNYLSRNKQQRKEKEPDWMSKDYQPPKPEVSDKKRAELNAKLAALNGDTEPEGATK